MTIELNLILTFIGGGVGVWLGVILFFWLEDLARWYRLRRLQKKWEKEDSL